VHHKQVITYLKLSGKKLGLLTNFNCSDIEKSEICSNLDPKEIYLNQQMNTTYQYRDKLESKRLVSRFLNRDDISTWSQFFLDREAIELFPASFLQAGGNYAEKWIERQMTRYAENLFGLQALINRTNGEFIGQCGLLKQEVDCMTETEVGYHIFKKHWGKGYAPEAARMFMDYAFADNISGSLISIIDIRNAKSQRVAEKNGLKIEKQTSWNGLDVYIYRVWKPVS
jgi:ribosomal-protein-alanine N-acetyltransferase